MPNLLRIAALLLLSASAAVHATPASRVHVDAVAAAIADRYFDPERGKRIADDLRRDAATGAYDALQAQALADALTARLRPLDRHFRVRWSAPGDAARPPAPRRTPRTSSPNGIVEIDVLPGDIGYLRLDGFAHFEPDDTDAPARVAIDAALATLSGTGVNVIDLRGNRGGSPSMVGYLASAFVEPDADVYNAFHTRTDTFSEAPLHPYAHPRTRVPVYVLIDGGTASAAEAFTYTLQSARRATVIGERSAGAANPGGEVDVGAGFRVFVSDGTPVNPITRTNWEGSGVAPDVAVAASDALDEALQRARRSP
ncbi:MULTISPECIES: S41 family peptidase [unclassified Lysobacter]|uniref:S41 family peptidase n=1 Tax=unclassified Lysobacter TaxID=2635362 RepID=UPI001C21428B|nr:S41 family peptidase [Lysobacter sp. MMG2]MBU8977630.1 S41 family peptidase [Lysobacter sp. MMG2]